MAQLLYFLASVGNLFLALLVVFRARRARGAFPIVLLCLSLFVWDVAEAAKPPAPPDDPGFWSPWHTLELIGTSMVPAFLWHFVVLFVRRERSLRAWVAVLYAASGVFALSTAAAFFLEPFEAFVRGIVWNILYLAVLFPFLVASLLLVRSRYHEIHSRVERNAVLFVAAGIAVGTLTGLTDLTYALFGIIPPLGHVGTVMCTLVLAIAILRHRLLEEQTPVREIAIVFLLVLSGAFVLTILSPELPGRWDLTLVSGAVVAVTTLAIARLLVPRWSERAERKKRLALIGTMAAGVAHEIKNPLASIRGAAQYIEKELESGHDPAAAKEYARLVIGEVDRLNGVVESFLTYARPFHPKREEVPLGKFLEDLVRLQEASLPEGVRLQTAVDPDAPSVWADPDLLNHAVTNVVLNAVEAIGGGTVRIVARRATGGVREYGAIEVIDGGPGIARDDMDRIFQPFFTTKTRGTGLGLAIAHRIMEAHGGELRAENAEPRGCRFTFLVPVRAL